MTHPQTQDDEALVEVIVTAEMAFDDATYRDASFPFGRYGTRVAYYEARARAALTALRNHEGRKGCAS